MSVMAMYMGSCLFFIAIAFDIKCHLEEIDLIAVKKLGKLTCVDKEQLKSQLLSIAGFHSESIRSNTYARVTKRIMQ